MEASEGNSKLSTKKSAPYLSPDRSSNVKMRGLLRQTALSWFVRSDVSHYVLSKCVYQLQKTFARQGYSFALALILSTALLPPIHCSRISANLGAHFFEAQNLNMQQLHQPDNSRLRAQQKRAYVSLNSDHFLPEDADA